MERFPWLSGLLAAPGPLLLLYSVEKGQQGKWKEREAWGRVSSLQTQPKWPLSACAEEHGLRTAAAARLVSSANQLLFSLTVLLLGPFFSVFCLFLFSPSLKCGAPSGALQPDCTGL